jgi:hypothetical protein
MTQKPACARNLLAGNTLLCSESVSPARSACSAGVPPAPSTCYKLRMRIRLPYYGILLLFLLTLSGCAAHKTYPLPPYEQFVSAREEAASKSILEIYGQYSASAEGRTFRSSFNLLLEPGKEAYLELLDPSKQLLYAVSIDPEHITLLWARDQNYIREKSSPETLNAIAGLPLSPDDVLQLIAGYGLRFTEWQVEEVNKDGWDLKRSSFHAQLHMGADIVKIVIHSPNYPELVVRYSDYKTSENRPIPGSIGFEVPKRKLKLNWKIEKYLPRDQPPSPELFTVQLPPQAHRLSLQEIYKGKPLLLQQ